MYFVFAYLDSGGNYSFLEQTTWGSDRCLGFLFCGWSEVEKVCGVVVGKGYLEVKFCDPKSILLQDNKNIIAIIGFA